MRNLDTDEYVSVYKDGTVVVIVSPENNGEIALSREDAKEMARQLLAKIEESE